MFPEFNDLELLILKFLITTHIVPTPSRVATRISYPVSALKNVFILFISVCYKSYRFVLFKETKNENTYSVTFKAIKMCSVVSII